MGFILDLTETLKTPAGVVGLIVVVLVPLFYC